MRDIVAQAEAMARQTRMLDQSRAEQREMTRMLVLVLALSPYTRATDAPAGQRGRPIEPVAPRAVLPAQREPVEVRTPRRPVPRGTPTRPRNSAR